MPRSGVSRKQWLDLTGKTLRSIHTPASPWSDAPRSSCRLSNIYVRTLVAIRAWPGPGDHIITASCGHGTTVVTVDDRLVERKIGNAFHVIWIGVDSGNFFGRGGRPSR